MLEKMRRPKLRSMARLERGFTLVELMAVVAIIGILAAICIALARKHLRSAGTVEAVGDLQGLRAAEESFKAENGRYLNCSRTAGPVWYPMAIPGKSAYSWVQPDHPDYIWWNQLAYKHERTRFGYAVNAGLPGETFNAYQMNKSYKFLDATMTEPWYVIQMKGDRDANGRFALGMITSLSSDMYLQDEDE
jgi:prepilin-type N-terminal cleavage/methylation domain-containing protein